MTYKEQGYGKDQCRYETPVKGNCGSQSKTKKISYRAACVLVRKLKQNPHMTARTCRKLLADTGVEVHHFTVLLACTKHDLVSSEEILIHKLLPSQARGILRLKMELFGISQERLSNVRAWDKSIIVWCFVSASSTGNITYYTNTFFLYFLSYNPNPNAIDSVITSFRF